MSAVKDNTINRIWIILTLHITLIVSITPEEAHGRFTGFNLSADYEKRDRPSGENKHEPLEVNMKVIIVDITQVKEDRNEIKLDLIIRSTWIEDRLEYTTTVEPGQKFAVDQEDASKFWKPAVYIAGMTNLSTMFGSMDLTFFMVSHGKRVINAFRAKLVMKCDFFFDLYPLDIQDCKIDIMCPFGTSSEMKLNWWKETEDDFEVRFIGDPLYRELPRHHAKLAICQNNFNTPFVWGNVSSLRFRLVLQRNLQSYMLDTYLPTVLFVVMSWGSFLVKPDIVPGRMVLLVTNLLSLVTLFEASRNSSPPSLSIKAVEVWMISCIVFVFLALLEYAVVLYGMLRGAASRTNKLKLFVSVPPSYIINEESAFNRKLKKLKLKCSPIIMRLTSLSLYQMFIKSSVKSSWVPLDRASIVLFPLLFAAYNITYWSIYISRRIALLEKHKECPHV